MSIVTRVLAVGPLTVWQYKRNNWFGPYVCESSYGIALGPYDIVWRRSK